MISERIADNETRTWEPQPGPQTRLVKDFFNVYEIFYGGARGGGKTDGMLGDWLVHERIYGGAARGMFVRRFYTDLEDVMERAHQIFLPLGARWNGSTKVYKFPSGATLRFRHCRDETVAERYQGHSYTRVYAEEMQQWPTSEAIDKLRATLRSASGVVVGLRGTGNPGGPGHHWVKKRYIDPDPLGGNVRVSEVTGETVVFIAARLEDNVLLMERDPNYERRLLAASTHEQLVKAWRWGIWDIVAGGYFSDLWQPSRQVVEPFEIPPGWTMRRSFDWGTAKPASLGLWALSDGATPVLRGPLRGRYFPRGSAFRIGEVYFAKKDRNGFVIPNEGARLTNGQMGAEIARAGGNRQWRGCVADPSIFVSEGGPSIYDQLQGGARLVGGSVSFGPADNRRIPGWERMREMLKVSGSEETPESPGLWIFSGCKEWIRTVPVLEVDSNNQEDVDTEQEDHTADETRYLCQSVGSFGNRFVVKSSMGASA